jgi:hypothetical protein
MPSSASAIRAALGRYAVAWVYLAGVSAAELSYALLSPRDRVAVLRWASSNVHNLQHHPVGCLIASAFFSAESLTAWPPLIALSLFGANAALGTWRTAVTCASGQIVGTLVSEGILWYRIDHGTMPPADRFIVDVGPSYVVVTAIVVALIWGSWIARASAAVAFVLLIWVGEIFSGLSQLEVSAVGHVTAIFVGATLGSFLAWQRRRRGRALADCPS